MRDPPHAGQEPGRVETAASTWSTKSAAPVVVGINARAADGPDTSWLWDVPFERLAGRSVVATGDRRLDLRSASITPWWPSWSSWSPCAMRIAATGSLSITWATPA